MPIFMYLDDIINQLMTISDIINVVMDQNISESEDKKYLKLHTLDVKKNKLTIYVKDRQIFIQNMNYLHTLHWKYIDKQNIKFNRTRFIRHCNNLWNQYVKKSKYIKFVNIYKKYKNLEKRIPCSYGLITNIEYNTKPKLLLVRHHDSDLWSLPGGKMESLETYITCLQRELYEEIGYTHKIKDEKFIDSRVNKRKYRCYLLVFDENTKYATRSEYEIAEIKWFSVNALPKQTKLLQDALKKLCGNCDKKG